MYAIDFQYENQRLSDYGMMICSFGDSGSETVSSGSDLTFNQVRPSGSSRFPLYSSVYDAAYTATFQIGRHPSAAKNPKDRYLSPELVSGLQRWLCRKNEFHRFQIIQEDYLDYYWNATFSAKQIMINGRIAGLELTLITDAPYAFLDDITLEQELKAISDADSSFDLNNHSDETGCLYPNLEIRLFSSGKFELTTQMDNRTMTVDNCKYGETIQINGRNQIITTSLADHIIAKDFNYVFPRLHSVYQGPWNGPTVNTFKVNLPCRLKLTYTPIKKIGL